MDSTTPDRDFLRWFKRATEETWRRYAPREFKAPGAGGLDWQRGTRWRGGMTEAQIRAAEARFGVSFPPDYRLFLATLHTPDPAMAGAFYEGHELVPSEGRWCPDWTGDPKAIEAGLAWPVDGLIRSIEAEDDWHPAWGRRPANRQQREAVVRRLAAAGAQLIPVFGHRYLVGPPDRSGNPVLSIYGADVIVSGSDLWSYLVEEFHVAGRPSTGSMASGDGDGAVQRIPFWQDVIEGLVPVHEQTTR
jgi:hypothetical protein